MRDRATGDGPATESGDRGMSTPVELLRSLAVFAEPPGAEHERLTELLGFGAPPESSDYSDVFLFQLYPYASVHLGPEGMMGGEARDRVAGFWRALGQVPPTEPDHLAGLLGLYAALAEREGALDGAERALVRQSRHALLHEHLAPWVFGFLGRTQELTRGVYGTWAELLSRVLQAEVVGVDHRDDRLPLHLRLVAEMPDPNVEGGKAFLAGLLAPVLSGMILTRADLARLAGELDLGLRAGERRYALEHMLAQNPVSVLRALAAEARRQGAMHEQRASWLGKTAVFLAEQARRTSSMLDELADEEGIEQPEPVGDEATTVGAGG